MQVTIVKTPHREVLYVDGTFAAEREHFTTESLIEFTYGDLDFELNHVHYNKDLDSFPNKLKDLPN